MQQKEARKSRHEKAGKNKEKEEKSMLVGLSERQILLFLLEFMVVSSIILLIWYYIGEFYQAAIFFIARYILRALGYTPLQISAVNLSNAYLGNFNLVPFFALALVTPKLSVRRRLEMLMIGLPILFLLHVTDLVAHFPLAFYGSGVARLIVYSIGVAGVALPFVIWFAVCAGALSTKERSK